MANNPGGPALKMLTGKPMPLVGLGTAQAEYGDFEKAAGNAIRAGYRHIDTARWYGIEGEIGNALQKAYEEGKLKREDMYITTKLFGAAACPRQVKPQTEQSLKLLQTDYIDLLLIHFPVIFSDEQLEKDPAAFIPVGESGVILTDTEPLETYKEMEKLVDAGKVKALGLSNFNEDQIQRVWDNCRIKPSNLQCECNVWFQQDKLVKFCQDKGITFTAYSPLGCPKRPGVTADSPVLMKDPVVVRIAEEKKKTPAQILLKFLMQRNIIVLPRSTKEPRIKSNFEVFDFTLTDKDMKDLKALDKNERMHNADFLGPAALKHPQFPWEVKVA